MRCVRMTYVGQLILLLYEEEIFIAMQIPPKIPQKMFSLTRVGGADEPAAEELQFTTEELKSIGKCSLIVPRIIASPENTP